MVVETINEEANRLREERRAKMQAIKDNMDNSLWRDGVTSAPSVREVDEFHEELTAAEKRKRTAEKMMKMADAGPKAKLQLSSRPKESNQAFTDDDLDILESSLVSEALSRSRRTSVPRSQQQQLDNDIADIFHDDEEITGSKSMMIVKSHNADTDIVDVAKRRKYNSFRASSEKSRSSLGDISETKMVQEYNDNGNRAFKVNNGIGTANNDREDSKRQSFFMSLKGNNADNGNARPLSHTTKVYENGAYKDDKSMSSRSKIENGSDPLSQSLPTWDLKNMKKESQEVKCVYDSRIFGTAVDDGEYLKTMSKDIVESDAEDMASKKSGGKKDAFKEFLNASFSRGSEGLQKKSCKVDPCSESGLSLSVVKLEKECNEGLTRSDDTTIDCIDLNDHEYESVTTTYTTRSDSPTISMRTASEFGDPDGRGRAKVKKGLDHSIMDQMHTMVGSVFGSGSGRQNGMKSAGRPQTHQEKTNYMDSHDSNSAHKSAKRMSCWTLIFLLAVDAFTIGLVLALFSHHATYHTEYRDVYPSEGDASGRSDVVPRQERRISGSGGIGGDIEGRILSRNISVEAQSDLSTTAPRDPGISGDDDGRTSIKRDERDIIIRKSFQVLEVDSPSPNQKPPALPKFATATMTTTFTTTATSSSSSTTTTAKPDRTTTTSHSLMSDLQEQIRSVRNQFNYDITQSNDEWRIEIESLRQEINLLKKPPAFACHKSIPHTLRGTVTFSGCNVPTEGMNPQTGIFTVKVPGIYHISFTGLFMALQGHGVNADIIRRRQSTEVNLGRSKADTNEIATFLTQGTDDDLFATTTVITMDRFEVGDEVFIKMDIDGDHGKSYIFSSPDRVSIHFVGQKISD